MITRFHLWWRKIKKPQLIIETIAFLVVVVAIALGYWFKWGWTGFLNKTLWDWLQLLFVPIILAIGGFWLNQIQANITEQRNAREKREEEQRATREKTAAEQRAETELKIAKQRAETEREIASDNQREAALQAYIDKMSELLLQEKLRKSVEDEEVRSIARVRTLTVLTRLDSVRKRIVLQFLYESGLIDKDKRIVAVSQADLSQADLREANLSQADLREANLSQADLSGANLSGIDLRGTNLNRTNLGGSDLSGANLSGVDLRSTYLQDAKLSGADLSKAKLSGTDLSKAKLSDADLSGANLSDADLSGANLSGVDLRGAYLQGANLSEVDLSKAELRGADLSQANLSDADLSGADLRANLSGTLPFGPTITIEELEKAAYLKDAIMPDGSIHL